VKVELLSPTFIDCKTVKTTRAKSGNSSISKVKAPLQSAGEVTPTSNSSV